MTTRGDATRTRLLAATRDVVRDVGYAHASTRAIAAAAGVAEGTIYRHFPDKVTLLFAAVLDANQRVIDDVMRLPDLAGTGTVYDNLSSSLGRLATLRQDIIPLELAISADPELAARRDAVIGAMAGAPAEGPPQALAAYLAAEQSLGRIRSDLDAWRLSVVLLAALFGLGAGPTSDHAGLSTSLLETLVRVAASGLEPGAAEKAKP